MLNEHENIAATQQEIVSETLEEELQRRCSIIDQVVLLYSIYNYTKPYTCMMHLALGQT